MPGLNYSVIHRNMIDLEIKRRVAQLHTNHHNGLITIGIDPGFNIGVAVLVGNSVISTNVVMSIDRLVQWIKTQLKLVNSTETTIRIGDGWKKGAPIFIDRITREFHTVACIELVDEARTSLKIGNLLSIHEYAAITIAKREGKKLTVG